jgi:hypothetical protein
MRAAEFAIHHGWDCGHHYSSGSSVKSQLRKDASSSQFYACHSEECLVLIFPGDIRANKNNGTNQLLTAGKGNWAQRKKSEHLRLFSYADAASSCGGMGTRRRDKVHIN